MLEARYIGPDLPAMFHATPAKHAARRMADKGGSRLHEEIVAYTPVRTGNLKSSWYRVPTVEEGNRYRTHVRTDVDYAVYVNYGTGEKGPRRRKYLIEPHRPRRYLHWTDPVHGEVWYKRVFHPGSGPAHMVEKGAHSTEAAIGMIMQSELEVFKREMEAQIAAGRMGTH